MELYDTLTDGMSDEMKDGFNRGTALTATGLFLKFTEIMDNNKNDVQGFNAEIIGMFAELGLMLHAENFVTTEELLIVK